MARKIEVVDYCPEWKEKFWQEAAKIQEILGENCITVYHIGSTPVKGLRAKPIIDLMPVVKELEAVLATKPRNHKAEHKPHSSTRI